MKVVRVVLIVLFIGVAAAAFCQTSYVSDDFSSPMLKDWMKVSGSWRVLEGRLYQTDRDEKMAMITIPVSQSGKVLYEFNVRYVGGGEDNYAGFGIHICVDNPATKRSWGNGQSILGWVTWDPDVYGYPGAFIQVYESRGSTDMGLWTKVFPGSDPVRYGGLIPIRADYLRTEYLDATVPIKIMLDTRTGEGRFYDPMDPNRYYYGFNLGTAVGSGSYFSIRMNSVALSIDNVKVSKVY